MKPMRLHRFSLALLLMLQVPVLNGQTLSGGVIGVSTVNQENQPLSGVTIQLKVGQDVIVSAITDQNGHAEFSKLQPNYYEVVAEKMGFEPANKADLNLLETGSISLELTLVPKLAH